MSTEINHNKHDRKNISVHNKGKSCCVIEENNNAYCPVTDRLFLEWCLQVLHTYVALHSKLATVKFDSNSWQQKK